VLCVHILKVLRYLDSLLAPGMRCVGAFGEY
jgi:hypothetical protein